ncbi:MAG: peptidoglycan DD-metalloendopeptidase family protein [Richelia sp. RM2_1_2]|nr:peptidoglycan DD-metalloendopeptidase family protein [Richelia sp. RM1_1_1]NJO65774.1 peptidoglycan DD-metalloendopeptidase family protein [Richelia sp. RM2_1_2]
MRIKLEIESNNTKIVGLKESGSGLSVGRNWGYAFATLILCMAIAFPQVSEWVESQQPIRLLQRLAKNTSDVTDLKSTAFPTIKGTPVTSGFGWRTHPLTGERKFHYGIDFGASKGTPIYAFEAGLVEFAGWKGGYGKAVIINHGAGKSTLYGHASKLSVRKEEQVLPGQIIGKVGSTGMSTAPHLHFEVRLNNKPVNPRPYLQQHKLSSNYSPRMQAFLATIRWAETGTSRTESYQKLVFNGTFNNFSTHPLIKQCASINGKKTCSTAAGAYQMLDKSWRDLQPKLKLPDFSPESQDRMAIEYIRRNRAISDIESGNFANAACKVGKIWASFPCNSYDQNPKAMSELSRYYQKQLSWMVVR